MDLRDGRFVRGLAVATLSLGLIAGAGEFARAQDAGADDLARTFTEKFLGIGAGSRPQPAPPAVPSPAPPASTPTPTSPPTLFGIPVTTPTPAPAPQAGAAPPAGQFLLAGVVMAGDSEMAFLQEPGQTGARFVRVGESIGAYRLTAVQPDRVTLAGPGGEIVVLLRGGAVSGPSTPRGGESPAVEPASSGGAPGPDEKRARHDEKNQKKVERQPWRKPKRWRQLGIVPSPPAGSESHRESQSQADAEP